MHELVYAAVFYLLSAVILLSALGVVLKKNLVHSALLLTVAFIGVGGLFILLHADFLAAVQLLVYAGAVSIMIVLGIMLTRRDSMAASNPDHEHKYGAGLVSALFLLVMVGAFLITPWQSAQNSFADTVGGLADLMLTKYIVPFEAVAVLLLAAMIGAIILAKGADEV